jgi:hypothetical protein
VNPGHQLDKKMHTCICSNHISFGGSRQALIFLLHPIYSLFHTSAWQVRSLERFGLGSRSYYGLGFGGTRESASIEEVASWWQESIVEVAAGVGHRIGSNQSGVWPMNNTVVGC